MINEFYLQNLLNKAYSLSNIAKYSKNQKEENELSATRILNSSSVHDQRRSCDCRWTG